MKTVLRVALVLQGALAAALLLRGCERGDAALRPFFEPALAREDRAALVLAWAAARIPRDATVVYVNAGDEPAFFRASSELAPRPVIWIATDPRSVWSAAVPPDAGRFLERSGARFVLGDGVDPAVLGLDGEAIPFDATGRERLFVLGPRR